MCDLCDKTVFSGGRASLLPPAPFLSKRHDTHGATRLLGPRRTLYGRKSTTFSANGQKISLLFPSSVRKTAFSTFESRFSITFSGSLPDSHCGHTSYYRGIAPSPARERLSPPPEGAAGAADGGARASSGGTSPRSPPDEGETPRGLSARNPKSQRVDCRGESKFPRVPAPASGAAVAPPGRRPSAGRAGKAWRNHVEAQGIFARGNGRMRPRSGRFERGHGRLSALGGKKQHPLRAPGQVGGAAQTNQCRHLGKIDVVNEIRAPLAAPVTNDRRRAPRSPRRTTANSAARRERRRKPRGARRRRDEASCVVPPLASAYLSLARCRLTRRNSRSAVCALRFARAA